MTKVDIQAYGVAVDLGIDGTAIADGKMHLYGAEIVIVAGMTEADIVEAIRDAMPRPAPVFSDEFLASRTPPPPEQLVDALHDQVHRDIGVVRRAGAVPSGTP